MAIYGDGKHDSGTEVSLQTIKLDCGIELVFDTVSGSGHLHKGLTDREEESEDCNVTAVFNAAYDAIESLVLAHALAGIDVEEPAYQKGLQTTLEAIANNL